MKEYHKCQCGYKWIHGRDGNHSCEKGYMTQINELKLHLFKANASIAELRVFFREYIDLDNSCIHAYYNRAEELITKTPEQSLAAVKADAIRTMIDDNPGLFGISSPDIEMAENVIKQYANDIERSGQSIK